MATYNIQGGGMTGKLESLIQELMHMRVDLCFIQECNLHPGCHTKSQEGYNVFATYGKTKIKSGVALIWKSKDD